MQRLKFKAALIACFGIVSTSSLIAAPPNRTDLIGRWNQPGTNLIRNFDNPNNYFELVPGDNGGIKTGTWKFKAGGGEATLTKPFYFLHKFAFLDVETPTLAVCPWNGQNQMVGNGFVMYKKLADWHNLFLEEPSDLKPISGAWHNPTENQYHLFTEDGFWKLCDKGKLGGNPEQKGMNYETLGENKIQRVSNVQGYKNLNGKTLYFFPLVKNQGMLLVEIDADGNFLEDSFLISFGD